MALPVNFGANSQEMADFAKVLAKVQAKVGNSTGLGQTLSNAKLPCLTGAIGQICG
jgi:hypothetical protein